MALLFLSSAAPPEIIINILQHCESTSEVFAFVQTCSFIYRIWQANAASVLWHVWLRELEPFDEALIAYRMTQTVLDANRRRELPPIGLSPAEMSGFRSHPSLEELRGAFVLHRAARCLAINIHDLRMVTVDDGHLVEHPDHRMPEVDTTMRMAIYRMMIAGAALCGPYNEPLFEAGKTVELESDLAQFSRGEPVSDKLSEFFLSFPVCRLSADLEAEASIFDPLAQWLVGSILADEKSRTAMADRFERGYGRALNCPNLHPPFEQVCHVRLADGGSHADAHLVAWQVMQMLWVLYQLRVIEGRSYSSAASLPDDPKLDKANVTFLDGRFAAVGIILPHRIPSLSEPCPPGIVRMFDPSHLDDEAMPYWAYPCAARMLDHVTNESSQANFLEDFDSLVPHAGVKFFEYVLGRFLDARLKDGLFNPNWLPHFNANPLMFVLDDVKERTVDLVPPSKYCIAIDGCHLTQPFGQRPDAVYRRQVPS